MDLSGCLAIYTVVVILIVVVMYKLGKTIWASILFASIIGLILLFIINPPSEIDPWSTGTESMSAIYLLIVLLTPIYVTIYALTMAWNNSRSGCDSYRLCEAINKFSVN
jgi:hypothetical protein